MAGPDLRLHEEYFLLAHDDYTGRARIRADVLGAGVAAALLADLVLAGSLDVTGEHVAVRDPGAAFDVVGEDTVAAVTGRPARPVPWWLESLAASAFPRTAEQLVRRGVLTWSRVGLLRPGLRYPAVDALVAAGPRVRLRHEAGVARPVPAVAALAALAVRTGLGGVVADAANRSVRDGLLALARAVPVTLHPVVDGLDETLIRMALTTPRGR